jgi:hypothetical protein
MSDHRPRLGAGPTRGGNALKRLLLVLTVGLMMAAMLVVMAAPAFAYNGGEQPKGPPSYSGGPGNGSISLHDKGGSCVQHYGPQSGFKLTGKCS